MLLSKATCIFSYIYVYYLFHSSTIDVVHGGYNSAQSAGVNRSCAAFIRVSALTKQLDRGQSLFYDEQSNSLIFTDGELYSVYRYFIDSGHYYNITLQGSREINLIVPVEGLLDTYLIGYGNDLAILKWNCYSGNYSFRTLGVQDPSRPYPQSIVNAVKVGRTQSRPVFFYSTPKLNVTKHLSTYPTNISKLYDFVNGKKKVLLSNLRYGRGLGFSCDGKTIFYTDYGRNQTFRASYNEKTNSIENVKLLFDFSILGIHDGPNSMTIDAQGYIWLCTQSNHLLKVNPYNGNVECAIELPAPTSGVVFGRCPNSGSNTLNCIYVATRSNNVQKSSNWNGRLLLIEGVHSTGLLDYKVPLSTIYGHTDEHYYG